MNKYEKYLKDRKNNRILIVILIIGVLSLFSLEIYRIFFSDAYYDDVLNYTEVPVLTTDKQQRDLIEDSDIVYKKIPEAYLSEDVITDKQLLINKYVKLANTIEKDLPITKNQVEDRIFMNDYANTMLNENQILFPVNVNLLKTAGNNIKPSMNVDVYLTIEDDGKYISDILLENVRVIGVKDNEGNDIWNEDSDSIPYVVLLAIDDEYVNLMNIAEKIGEIELFIKNDSYNLKKESKLNKNSEIYNYFHKSKS